MSYDRPNVVKPSGFCSIPIYRYQKGIIAFINYCRNKELASSGKAILKA